MVTIFVYDYTESHLAFSAEFVKPMDVTSSQRSLNIQLTPAQPCPPVTSQKSHENFFTFLQSNSFWWNTKQNDFQDNSLVFLFLVWWCSSHYHQNCHSQNIQNHHQPARAAPLRGLTSCSGLSPSVSPSWQCPDLTQLCLPLNKVCANLSVYKFAEQSADNHHRHFPSQWQERRGLVVLVVMTAQQFSAKMKMTGLSADMILPDCCFA